ncbi:MAG TPA: hypothetical protein VG710_02395 [Opitutus sp.]|nr:hypothetical protein [Opitutus sp.]
MNPATIAWIVVGAIVVLFALGMFRRAASADLLTAAGIRGRPIPPAIP